MAKALHAAGRALAGAAVEGGVVETINPSGRHAVLLVCEHASNFIPDVFDSLGLSDSLRESHIAWDPGALAVAKTLSAELDARLVAQRVSCLLYDCNRPPIAESAVPVMSEIHPIPGNGGLSAVERQARVEAFYVPFRQAINAALDERIAVGPDPVLVTVHSFTPVYREIGRDVELGIICDSDSRLARALMRACAERPDIDVRFNEPYGPADGVTHTLVDQALPRGLLNVMLEIRNDLIADRDQQRAMGRWLAACLRQALQALEETPELAREERSTGS